ncbi:Lcl domain-containing protein [Desulfobotulus alkaliphilus]|nr:DUF1566 domain-containing protein [Desulfobotulus alkaliphilus]
MNLESPVADHPGQDADFGRDAAARAGRLSKKGSGAAGFDFTRLGQNGQPLAIQNRGWSDTGSEAEGTQWACVQDNHTGLIWEVKAKEGLRSREHTYSWYNPDNTSNGGEAGTQNGGACTGSSCDTLSYVQTVNSQGLCGFTDWRMPTRNELLSLVYFNSSSGPQIDVNHFPNTRGHSDESDYWTASPVASSTPLAWTVFFNTGLLSNDAKSAANPLRLVRSAGAFVQPEDIQPLAHYCFEDALNPGRDCSGNGNDSSGSSGTPLRVAAGHGHAIYLDGNMSHFEGSAMNFPSGAEPRTLCLWAKSSVTGSHAAPRVAFSWGHEAGIPRAYGLMQNNVPWVESENWFTFLYAGSQDIPEELDAGVAVSGDWQHICTSYDGNTVRHHINGELTTTHDLVLNTGNEFFRIGNKDGDGPFHGYLDEIRIYGSALSSTAIQTLYDSEAPEIRSPLLTAPVLRVQPGDGQVLLSWDAVPGADGYVLYYGTNPGIDPDTFLSYGERLELGNVSIYALTGLSNDTDYYFVLRPSASGQEADQKSEEITSRPVAVTITRRPLNDTGIDWWADEDTNNLTDPVATHPGQDADFGRDAMARDGALAKIGSGAAGFDFTKLGADGQPLAIQNGSWDEAGNEASGTKWSCVKDNHTGLIWEVKVNDPDHLRHMGHTYSWYNPDSNTNGGYAGTQNGGTCTGSGCDTFAFVQDVNAVGLCGASDWRMPTISELNSIVHRGRGNPSIDIDFFPNTGASNFWSSSPSASRNVDAWSLSFDDGIANNFVSKLGKRPVRLVLSGQ